VVPPPATNTRPASAIGGRGTDQIWSDVANQDHQRLATARAVSGGCEDAFSISIRCDDRGWRLVVTVTAGAAGT
jgi:hypothetical protein